MNKKKWKRKFAYRDSRRFLKHNKPFYSALHGAPKRREQVRELLLEYRQMEREYALYRHSQAYHVNRGKRLENVLEPPRSDRWRGMLAVREAKGITAHRLHKGHTALKLMELMYWPRDGASPLKLDEAADKLGLTQNQARHFHNGFLRLVEERYRLKKGDVW